MCVHAVMQSEAVWWRKAARGYRARATQGIHLLLCFCVHLTGLVTFV
jgi:hypothetical protein